MSLWAIVPVKPFSQSKTRLAASLSPEERVELSREFLGRTLGVLAQVPGLSQIVVVSRDAEALRLAQQIEVQPLAEASPSDLNAALTQATQFALAGGAGEVLALPTDLPFLSVAALVDLIEAGPDRAIHIAPDRHETGTNALYMRPPGLIPYAFGPESFRRHQALAAAAGIRPCLCRQPELAFDIDTPDDLRLFGMPQKI